MAEIKYPKRGEVQQRYGFSERTLYRLMAAQKFPKPITFSPRNRKWRLDDLQAWERSLRDEA